MVRFLTEPYHAWTSQSVTLRAVGELLDRNADFLGAGVVIVLEVCVGSTEGGTEWVGGIFLATIALCTFDIVNPAMHLIDTVGEDRKSVV